MSATTLANGYLTDPACWYALAGVLTGSLGLLGLFIARSVAARAATVKVRKQ